MIIVEALWPHLARTVHRLGSLLSTLVKKLLKNYLQTANYRVCVRFLAKNGFHFDFCSLLCLALLQEEKRLIGVRHRDKFAGRWKAFTGQASGKRTSILIKFEIQIIKLPTDLFWNHIFTCPKWRKNWLGLVKRLMSLMRFRVVEPPKSSQSNRVLCRFYQWQDSSPKPCRSPWTWTTHPCFG